MSKTRKKLLFILILTDFSLLIFTVFFCHFFNPYEIIKTEEESMCIFQRLYGLYCPGCGGTRAVGYLLSFDFINSFIYYPPITVGIFLLFFVNVLLIISIKKDSFDPIRKHKYFEFLLIPASVILTFLLRNILLFWGIDFIGDIL